MKLPNITAADVRAAIEAGVESTAIDWDADEDVLDLEGW